jgi:hypothetical protein
MSVRAAMAFAAVGSTVGRSVSATLRQVAQEFCVDFCLSPFLLAGSSKPHRAVVRSLEATRDHVLFLTDRNSRRDQAYRAFSAYSASERVQADKETVVHGQRLVGKIFDASNQYLDEELDGEMVFQHSG